MSNWKNYKTLRINPLYGGVALVVTTVFTFLGSVYSVFSLLDMIFNRVIATIVGVNITYLWWEYLLAFFWCFVLCFGWMFNIVILYGLVKAEPEKK